MRPVFSKTVLPAATREPVWWSTRRPLDAQDADSAAAWPETISSVRSFIEISTAVTADRRSIF